MLVVKDVKKKGDNAKVAVRNVRRDGIDALKKMEKAKEISEDETKKYSNEIQKITDEFNKSVDKIVEEKEKELMKI